MSWFKTPPKPDDEVRYTTGFACEKGHPQFGFGSTPADIEPMLGRTQVCEVCGEVSYPAVIRQTWPAILVSGFFSEHWMTRSWSYLINEFVHYLDKEPDVGLSDHAVSKLKELAARGPSPLVLPEERAAYEAGLKDGVTELAKFVLEEMKENNA